VKYVSDERDHKDPVCGMLVSRLTAVAEARHEGKVYYFCATECRDAFLTDPDKYLPRHRQHGVPSKPARPR
jgi:YHS domain-containing protein